MNMQPWYVFFHVLSVVIWLGGSLALLLFISKSLKIDDKSSQLKAFNQIHNWNITIYLPIGLLTLISGLKLWSNWLGEAKPGWLLVKERFGAPFLIIMIILIFVLGKKWLKILNQDNTDTGKYLCKYRTLMSISVIGMLVLFYVGEIKSILPLG